MALIDELSLKPLGEGPDGLRRSEVWRAGSASGLIVKGEVLEAAVRVATGIVLFVSYGDDYEDSLSIVLADHAMAMLDQAVLAASGVNGRFGSLILHPPGWLEFSFLGARRWRLDIYERPRLAPWPIMVNGLWRGWQMRRWFGLTVL